METHKLDVLFFKEGDIWIGQCLQHNIAVPGRNLRECMQELTDSLLGCIVIASELGMDHPFMGIPPAPAKYWEQYHAALKLCPEESTFRFPEGIPPAFMIQPSDLEIRVYG